VIVLDASALVDVVIDQPTKPWALSQLESDRILAPAHQLAEVLSAVSRLVRAGKLSPAAAADAMTEARALEQDHIAPSRDHLLRALDLQARVRVLDGLYVALAEERDAPLVTTDRRLARTELAVDVIAPI
jgi:predicted nucleic acid-binding protein